jgi:prepilin-type N-terminal cleavage/methylation domain-containing protein
VTTIVDPWRWVDRQACLQAGREQTGKWHESCKLSTTLKPLNKEELMFKRNRQKGFTLIELLIVVAIIGIIAAILIPNLLDALQKAKQKRTVADIRNTGTSWMSWLTDQVGAASAGAGTYEADDFNEVSYVMLYGYLHPTSTFFYMQEVPQVDGWKGDIGYAANLDGLTNTQVMVICSNGRDVEPPGTECDAAQDWDNLGPFVATDYDQDIAWADGYFLRYPQ